MKTGVKLGIATTILSLAGFFGYKAVNKRLDRIYNDIQPIYDRKLDDINRQEEKLRLSLEKSEISGNEYNSQMRAIRNNFSNIMNEYDREVSDRFFGRV